MTKQNQIRSLIGLGFGLLMPLCAQSAPRGPAQARECTFSDVVEKIVDDPGKFDDDKRFEWKAQVCAQLIEKFKPQCALAGQVSEPYCKIQWAWAEEDASRTPLATPPEFKESRTVTGRGKTQELALTNHNLQLSESTKAVTQQLLDFTKTCEGVAGIAQTQLKVNQDESQRMKAAVDGGYMVRSDVTSSGQCLAKTASKNRIRAEVEIIFRPRAEVK